LPEIKFKVGDHVERIGSLVPQYMRSGVVTRVIPNKDGLDLFTEYEVNFDNTVIATFYQTQLRLAKPTESAATQIQLDAKQRATHG
jgi:hypothetical protein